MENSPNSLSDILRDLRSETMTLLRQEVALARVEIGEKSAHVAKSAAKAAAGGLVAYAGLIVLLFGLSGVLATGLVRAGVEAGMATWLAPSIVGAIVIAVGWAIFAKAKKALTPAELVPEETLETLRENKQWAQTKFKPSHEPST